MLTPILRERIISFLPTVRVGIDFGESAGGIAVVQGNRILHAETYIDFHASDLEQRRQLRRGRRTRRAKKMRLARLRSWVLRQKLLNGARLPDPYAVMKEPRFHVQPGIFQTTGSNPATVPSWIDLAKQGKVDASGFVRALTLIFQKRGFKWDAIELEKMTDEKLRDFFQKARVPDDDLAGTIRNEIERRRENPDDPARGRKKVQPDQLVDLLNQARGRKPQPRVAEHRSVKEADVRSVVEGFGNSINLSKDTIQRWQRELCGLLNKVLRPARFDNRLKTGCAWCGKPTPRKAKVREIAYEAAVRNLRVREGRFLRPLRSEELAVFKQWWALRGQTGESQQDHSEKKRSRKTGWQTVPKLKAIQTHLKKLRAQEQMARQISDLLWNEKPQGRASLCSQHLSEAAQGKTMKDVVGEWHTVKVRKAPNPCREQHDARVLHRLEQILFKPGRNGPDAWRHGPVQFVTIEVPKPQTEQARKGEQKLRKPESFMDRLKKETDSRCIYCDSSNPHLAEDKDHIFPQSRGGPDVWDNLVPVCRSCNMAKGDRTPFEWIGADTERWRRFIERVEGLAVRGICVEGDDGTKQTIRVSERKRTLLLSRETDYPENSTPLAHVGARPRQFVVALRELFEGRGVAAPTVNFETGMPFVQRIDGRTTSQLRKSWLKKADGTDNFPLKNDRDLLNHAQDAALIAACPPHTWRETIFRSRAIRPRWDGTMTEQDGLAAPELAPDWVEYLDRRTWPLVKVLGRYPISWKRKFADLTFSQNPDSLDDKRLVQYLPLDDLAHSGKGPDERRHPAETEIADPSLDKKFRALATQLGLKKKQTIPEKNLREHFPGVRHVKIKKQPGGRQVRVAPWNGPARKVEIKAASEAVVFWIENGETKTKLRMSVRWPTILQDWGLSRYEPPIPGGATVLATWVRHQFIRLGPETGYTPGFYRVKEFDGSSVTLLPERAIPDALAMRVNLRKRKNGQGESQESASAQEIKLGKAVLAKYFESLNGGKHHDPGTGS
jgi:5-methylcytosine-specific restriction endonuclease McrA